MNPRYLVRRRCTADGKRTWPRRTKDKTSEYDGVMEHTGHTNDEGNLLNPTHLSTPSSSASILFLSHSILQLALEGLEKLIDQSSTPDQTEA